MNIRRRVIQGFAVGAIAVLAVLVAAAVALAVTAHQTKALQRQDPRLAAPATGSFVDAQDSRLFVQRLGPAGAPVVVFVHGTGSWSETWRASMEHVAGLGYQAVALDLPPFGYSIAPASGDYSKPQQARRILAALDNLGITRATFVAHSFGAGPVVEALLAEPQRATKLVLVDAALGLEGPQTDGSPNRVQSLLRNKWLGESISAALLTNPSFTEALLKSFVSEKDKATAEWVGLYQRPLTVTDRYRDVAQWLPYLLANRGQDASDRVEAYARLRFPVTLLWGETDTITPLEQARHLQGWLPHAELLVIPKAGHIPQIEEPELFRAALAKALGPAQQ